MNCAYHPTAEAVAACANCGREICPECQVTAGARSYCKPCAGRLAIAAAPAPSNTSGIGGGVSIPAEATRWNWGALLLTPVWSIFNHVWIELLSLIEPIGFIVSIIVALKGSEWAWRSRRWDSIEHFKRTQRAWAVWGLVITFLGLAIFILFVALGAMADTTRWL